MAASSAPIAGESRSLEQGETPPGGVCTSASMPAGRLASTQARNCGPTSSGRWSETSRKVTLACASAGMIVLWPGPV